jgi:hypothetical protein
MLRAIRVLWCLLALCPLGWEAYALIFNLPSDAIVVFFFAMGVISFPAGLLPLYGHSLVAPISTTSLGGVVELLVIWSLITVAGYFQWFVLLPGLIRSIRERVRKNQGRTSEAH